MRPFGTDWADGLIRPRVNKLLTDAVKLPLTIVRAGAGCGKTRAVFDFTHMFSASWMQLSERDNAGSRFWAKYIKLIAGWNEAFTEHCRELGFPDTEDKLNRHFTLRKRYAPTGRRIIVIDDLHIISHPDVLLFLERGLREIVENTSVILICRELPDINLTDRQMREQISVISEEDLNFTENELAIYFSKQGLSVPKVTLRDVLEDTGGWAFSVNFVAQALKRSPGYAGYAGKAMKHNIFKLMETEVFNTISGELQRFLVRLSLIDHLSAELIAELAGEDESILSELKKQNAYIRFDSFINAYQIHHLFLGFLRAKKHILSEETTSETYRTAARWCVQNGFESDALSYFEKLGDYESIVSVLTALPVQMPRDIALQAADILGRAPEDAGVTIDNFAVMHVRMITRLCRYQEALALMQKYERRFLPLPEGHAFRNRTLRMIYYNWGNVRALMCTADGRFDFDLYYAKMDVCLTKAPVGLDQYADLPIGFWASLAGSSPRLYMEAAERTVKHVTNCWNGATAGIDVLCRAELLFYQGESKAAHPLLMETLRKARGNRQFEIEHKALFYLMRLALWRGDYEKARRILREMETKLGEKRYYHRFLNYDAALAFLFLTLRRSEDVPVWLTGDFAPYAHAYFIENLANQLKARYHYLTRNYPPLLAYIADMKHRESILYGRVEMLALEACVHYKMKNVSAALEALQRAYNESSADAIVAPFIELGKDMRTLVSRAKRESGIPQEWLESVRRRSSSFAKIQSVMIAGCEKDREIHRGLELSARESEVLSDLCRGLSRTEIAEKQSLSVNTVNSVVNNIFSKLGARNTIDAVRIAAEERLI